MNTFLLAVEMRQASFYIEMDMTSVVFFILALVALSLSLSRRRMMIEHVVEKNRHESSSFFSNRINYFSSYPVHGRNFKAKMVLNNKEWHIKTYIHQSAMKISIIHS